MIETKDDIENMRVTTNDGFILYIHTLVYLVNIVQVISTDVLTMYMCDRYNFIKKFESVQSCAKCQRVH